MRDNTCTCGGYFLVDGKFESIEKDIEENCKRVTIVVGEETYHYYYSVA